MSRYYSNSDNRDEFGRFPMHLRELPESPDSFSSNQSNSPQRNRANSRNAVNMDYPNVPTPLTRTSPDSLYNEEMQLNRGRSPGDLESNNPYPRARVQFPEPAIQEDKVGRVSYLKRSRTVQRIPLFMGNLVLNCPVPDNLISNVPYNNTEEVCMTRYSAVTCDPDEFSNSNYTLRPVLYNRETEICIVVTMYNEDDELFAKTMTALMKNIAYLCERNRSSTWGPDGWKKIVVCIVADGRSKVHPRVLQCLGIMGVYQDGIMKSEVNGKEVQAHLFEYTTQICIDTDMKIKGPERGYVPVQMLFCLKEQNKKKLNSHRWFFNAFCPVLRPNVCILVDVGTKPTPSSIYHLWKVFDLDPNVGGACGEIYADLGTGCYKTSNPLVAAQNFEYKISNILDKPVESTFGFISVLPGAFSAYRYAALINSAPGVGPLASYFAGEKIHDGSAEAFKANMYLAEDRILCFELVAKRNANWILRYVKAARAETDVPEGIPEFISQRRRWLNGAFFAGSYALSHWFRTLQTNHSILQKLWFQVQLLYNLILMFFLWFGLGMFYLTFFYMTQSVMDADGPFGEVIGVWLFQVFRQLYIFTIVVLFIISLGNRPQGSKFIFTLTFLLSAVIMGVMIFLAVWQIFFAVRANLGKISGIQAFVENPAFRDMFVTIMGTAGLYLIISLLHGDPWHMFTCFFQYILLLPSFINVLPIYAFCNIHDISWGTKGDNKASSLGSVKSSKNGAKDTVDVELPFENAKDKRSLNEAYKNWMVSLKERPKEEKQGRDMKTKIDDYFKTFRTRYVLAWMFSNAAVIIILTNEQIVNWISKSDDTRSSPMLAFIFFSYLGLTFFRFVLSIVFLIKHYGSCRCCNFKESRSPALFDEKHLNRILLIIGSVFNYHELIFLKKYSKLTPEQISKFSAFKNGEIHYNFEYGPHYDKLMKSSKSAPAH